MLELEVTLQLKNLLILACVAFGFGLSYVIWRAPGQNRRAANCLSVSTLVTSVLALVYVLQVENSQARPWLYTLVSLQMLQGPLLYFYTRFQTEPDYSWHWSQLLHLLPAGLFGTLWLLQLPLSEQSSLYMDCPAQKDCGQMYQHRLLHRLAGWSSLICYSVLALRLLFPHQRRIKAYYSSIEGVQLNWLMLICGCYLASTVAIVVFDLLNYLGSPVVLTGAMMQAFAPFISVLLMATYGIRQVMVQFEDHSQQPKSPKTDTAESGQVQQFCKEQSSAKKYQTSSLTEQDAKALWQRLQHCMRTEQPHLEAGLKISDLAQSLGVSVNHLSETINGYANLSFYDFINNYRVEEAVRLLTEPKMDFLSVTEIGFQAGFNSNSTFFSQFKNRLQLTPKQYRKQPQSAVMSSQQSG
jgi:AraC-like DNA-binding protein